MVAHELTAVCCCRCAARHPAVHPAGQLPVRAAGGQTAGSSDAACVGETEGSRLLWQYMPAYCCCSAHPTPPTAHPRHTHAGVCHHRPLRPPSRLVPPCGCLALTTRHSAQPHAAAAHPAAAKVGATYRYTHAHWLSSSHRAMCLLLLNVVV